MTTPVEASFYAKAFGAISRGASHIFAIWKRVATLEARVTALEGMLKKQPGEECPACGERAMRLTKQSMLKGDPGKQWTEETYTCEKCAKNYIEYKKL